MQPVYQKLRRFNLIMGFLHLIQGVLMIILATGVIQKIAAFSPQITQFYLNYNTETQALETTSRTLFQLPFGILVGVFLLLSALAHALISLPSRSTTSTTAIWQRASTSSAGLNTR